MSRSVKGTIIRQRTIGNESTRIELVPVDEADGRIRIDRIHEYELVVDGGVAELESCTNPDGLPRWAEEILTDAGVRRIEQ